MSKIKYGYWREDKEKEPGYSRELISVEYDKYSGETTMDELECFDDDGLDTIPKFLAGLYKRMPDHPLLGTNKGDSGYEWMNVKDCVDNAKYFASACQILNLAPVVDATDEGKQWRFIGIQSKNRTEWVLNHWGNMLIGVTTVALYDTLGHDAFKYIVD